MMQQTVLLEITRGPDGITKYHPSKYLIRWVRRCILYGALDQNLFTNPFDKRGGSFTGPSYDDTLFKYSDKTWQECMDIIVGQYLAEVDMIPHHYHLHLMHAIEILGYKHPDIPISDWFKDVYYRFCNDMHVNPESIEQLNYRLGDNERQWRNTADPATMA